MTQIGVHDLVALFKCDTVEKLKNNRLYKRKFYLRYSILAVVAERE